MNALNIPRPILDGFDWGGRSANAVAALWPQRVSGLVAVSGCIVVDRAAPMSSISSGGVPGGTWVVISTKKSMRNLSGEGVRPVQRFSCPDLSVGYGPFDRCGEKRALAADPESSGN